MRYLLVFAITVSAVAKMSAQTLAGGGKSSSIDPESPSVASIISALPVRNVGPVTGGGGYRIDDIAVYEANSKIFYFASANGGVFKTTNGGKNF